MQFDASSFRTESRFPSLLEILPRDKDKLVLLSRIKKKVLFVALEKFLRKMFRNYFFYFET